MIRKTEILNWVAQGRLHAVDLPAALRLAGIAPDREGWRRFLDRLALWLGAASGALGVIFFFAYNWAAMGRFLKFGLIEILLLAAMVLYFRLGSDRPAAKVALLVCTVLVGALLALVGQTYQTGADPWELFAVWALMTFPWAAIGRFGALWLLWIGLLNLAATLYFQTFGGPFGLLLTTERLLWILFALNSAALAIWEFAARRCDWLRERWSPRILAAGGGGLITTLAIWAVLDSDANHALAFVVYPGWVAAAYACYRHWQRDLFVLAGGVLSLILVVTVALSRAMISSGNEAAVLLFIGLAVIGMSAVGGLWLKTVAAAEEEE